MMIIMMKDDIDDDDNENENNLWRLLLLGYSILYSLHLIPIPF